MWVSNTKVIGIYIFTSCLYGICLSFGNGGRQNWLTENVGFWIGLLTYVCFGMGLNHNIYIFIGVFMPQRPQSRKFGLAILRERHRYGHWLYHAFQSVCNHVGPWLDWFGINLDQMPHLCDWAASVLILFYFVISTSKKTSCIYIKNYVCLVYKTPKNNSY
jgi:hypothetical protein